MKNHNQKLAEKIEFEIYNDNISNHYSREYNIKEIKKVLDDQPSIDYSELDFLTTLETCNEEEIHNKISERKEALYQHFADQPIDYSGLADKCIMTLAEKIWQDFLSEETFTVLSIHKTITQHFADQGEEEVEVKNQRYQDKLWSEIFDKAPEGLEEMAINTVAEILGIVNGSDYGYLDKNSCEADAIHSEINKLIPKVIADKLQELRNGLPEINGIENSESAKYVIRHITQLIDKMKP